MTDTTFSARTLARLARLLDKACEDLSLQQFRLLALVEEGDERASRLADQLAIARPTVTAAVDSLVERGLLRRREVVGDRRAVSLQITPAGRKALRATETAMDARLAPVFARCDDAAAVHAALGALAAALDELAEERVASGAPR